MPVRTAEAVWKGKLPEGQGSMALGSGSYEGPYSFASRFSEGTGTNPEELIGAAHAGCFSMALAHMVGQAGYTPERVHTVARVHIDKVGDGFKITGVELETDAAIPEIEEQRFLEIAEAAKKGCPVSQALAGTDIKLRATLAR